MSNRYKILAEREIALESLDYKDPKGAVRDNSTNSGYISEIEGYFQNRSINYLDLGCAGGQLVVDFLKKGHTAFGIDGNPDIVKKNRHTAARRNWSNYLGKNLFNCDIAKNFQIIDTEDNNATVLFDCISAWEVLEHIEKSDLHVLMKNIHSNLKDGGIFVGSVNLSDRDPHHVSTFSEKIWRNEIFEPAGFRVEKYKFKNKVREVPLSFYVVLKKSLNV